MRVLWQLPLVVSSLCPQGSGRGNYHHPRGQLWGLRGEGEVTIKCTYQTARPDSVLVAQTCAAVNTRTTVQNWRASCHNYVTRDCLISRTDQPHITLVWPQCTTLTVCLLWSVDMYVPVKGEASKSFFVSSSTCGSLEIGTHTSVVIPWEHTTRKRLINFESSCGRTYSAQVGKV